MKKVIVISVSTLLAITFLVLIYYAYPRTGRYAMKVLDSLTVEREKLDSLLQKENKDKEEIKKQLAKVYFLLKRRIEREKGVKLIKQEHKDLIEQLKPIMEKLDIKDFPDESIE